MFKYHATLAAGLLAALMSTSATTAVAGDRIFFLHHSTGRNIINQGEMRAALESFNLQHDTSLEFWDHDYNYIGLREDEGDYLGYDYAIPNDNTDPDGLHYLWTAANSARDSLLDNHDVIAFKSCYPASAIETDQEFQQRQQWYREMRDVFDQHPDKIFVVVTQPPLHRLVTDLGEADRARAFANWLTSDEYLAGHDNVVGFDLFDLLAAPDDASNTRNMLRYEYERSHSGGDSHPNELANQTVGPVFMEFLALTALEGSATPVVDLPANGHAELLGAYPNPFNPSTRLEFRLESTDGVVLAIHDLNGRLIKTLLTGPQPAGIQHVTWDGVDDQDTPVASGVYFVNLISSTGRSTRMISLIK
jgi:hypothetical protein